MAAEGNQVIWRIAEGSGNRTYRVYRNPNKTGPIDSQSDYNPWPPPSTVWIEGIEDTGTCPSRIVMWVGTFDNLHCIYCGYEGQPMNVHGPALEWEKAASSNADIDDCPNNGGMRIFPDKLNPTDSPNPPDLRQQVNIVAKVDPPVAGMTVYFRVFDVDDPFDQIHGPQGLNDIASVNLIDADAIGHDNRPTGENPWPTTGTVSAPTGPDGKARVTFTVSMQPGNNYRAVASQSLSALNAVTQADADAMNQGNPQSPGSVRGCNAPLIWSPMLTVWRKLHVEVDSMQAEPGLVSDRSPDWDLVTIYAVTNDPPPAGTSTIRVVSQTTITGAIASGETNHYEGGTISGIAFANPLLVVGSGSDTLRVQRIFSQQEKDTMITLTVLLKDDDPTAPKQLPYYPAISDFVRNAYKRAYIDIISLPMSSNPHATVPFGLNLTDIEIQTGLSWDNSQDAFSSTGFWAALLVVAYQPGSSEDQDSDAYLGDNSHQIGTNFTPDPALQVGITVEDNDNASVVFIEVIRDIGPNGQKDLDHTIAHEIGHSAGPNTPAQSDHAELGIMTEGAPTDESNFSAASLKRFREANPW